MFSSTPAARGNVQGFRPEECGQEQRKAQGGQQQRCECALHVSQLNNTIKSYLAVSVKRQNLLHHDFGNRLILVFIGHTHGDGRFSLAAIH